MVPINILIKWVTGVKRPYVSGPHFTPLITGFWAHLVMLNIAIRIRSDEFFSSAQPELSLKNPMLGSFFPVGFVGFSCSANGEFGTWENIGSCTIFFKATVRLVFGGFNGCFPGRKNKIQTFISESFVCLAFTGNPAVSTFIMTDLIQ